MLWKRHSFTKFLNLSIHWQAKSARPSMQYVFSDIFLLLAMKNVHNPTFMISSNTHSDLEYLSDKGAK